MAGCRLLAWPVLLLGLVSIRNTPADCDEYEPMIYTAWGQDGRANTLVQGEEAPHFVDGAPFDDAAELIWRIEADSYEAAMQKYNDLQGWGTYKPIPLDPS
jgi:hypothetical protein